ncbi:MAG: DUF3793 family protein [Tissierella sp.]|uniref:DUF3793 family protein n=1 Tax=Tissierella sp. TaxID=41274 RepID=UPI003F9648BE
MHELTIVRHCSPTLAGIKTGNLFSYSFDCIKKLETQTKKLNVILNPKGVYIRILRNKSNRVLVYVYRPKKLVSDFLNKDIRNFLYGYGYTDFDANNCIDKLSKKLYENEVFPHEIGLFLEYPLNDVKGFIENNGQNYKYAGIWKVYSDESKAKEIFKRYKLCTKTYCERLAEGLSVEQLILP